ncbi:MAG: succinate--CoA ligase subunit alpha [Dehalococcoidia bacterium]|nr:succinate--CoA ligase subunit alpha [Dehalococcoidia bacterium]
MSILLNRNTRLLVQGITGAEGSNHARLCKAFGTNIVGGVTPGRAGQEVDGIPVFNTVDQAVAATQANASIIFVPAPFATDAIYEAVEAGLKLVVCITDGLPTWEMVKVKRYISGKDVVLIGPNCPGIISPPEKAKAGIMPASSFMPGKLGLVSRSGTLLYEAAAQMTAAGIGQSTAVGIGGDPVVGTDFVDILKRFNDDPDVEAIALIGEIGGVAEQEAAEYVKANVRKPMCAFIAGASAPPGRRMGHAGAIISGDSATADSKLKALSAAGAAVTRNPAEIGKVMAELLASRS